MPAPGWKHTAETKARIGAARRGKRHTDETKARMSVSQRARAARKHSDGTRDRMSVSQQARRAAERASAVAGPSAVQAAAFLPRPPASSSSAAQVPAPSMAAAASLLVPGMPPAGRPTLPDIRDVFPAVFAARPPRQEHGLQAPGQGGPRR
ncbi:NUMOD3 domain-containing DNA-binding protein [Streptomyces sp. NPDC058394]|uniref:NUMOD3 domain-containing DNA-binding protein n=1 Tax=Streptomyces sp. NPDC058394 TaxID=3346477 RepID=UPI0036564C11